MYPYNLDIDKVIDKIANVDKLELVETEIVSLKGNYWELVMEDLVECANNYLSKN